MENFTGANVWWDKCSVPPKTSMVLSQSDALVQREKQGWNRGAEMMLRPFLHLAECWGVFNFKVCIAPERKIKVSLGRQLQTHPKSLVAQAGF